MINKEKFSHKMLKEINEQPDVIKKTIEKYLDESKSKVSLGINSEIKKRLRHINRVEIIGCGTSFHASKYVAYLMAENTKLAVHADLADEFKSINSALDNKTLIIAISQSGETADILTAVRMARKKGALIIGLTNEIGSSLEKNVDFMIFTCAGKEQAVPATKTFTTQLVMLSLLAIYIGRFHGMPRIARKKMIKELLLLPAKIESIIKSQLNIQILAHKYFKKENYLILGKNSQYPVALEAALKFKEAAYCRAEGMAAGEFKHGPLAMLNKNIPCIFIAPEDKQSKENLKLIEELHALKNKIIIITTQGNRKLYRYADSIFYVPKTFMPLQPILTIIPLQILAYYIAVLKGINPDRPRNLRKFIV